MTQLLTNNNASQSTVLTTEERFLRLKKELHQQLITGMDLATIGTMGEQELRIEVRRATEELCSLRNDLLNLSERERLVNEVLDETFGLGPLEPLMRDPTVTDIMVNGPKVVYVERRGVSNVSTSSSTMRSIYYRSSNGSLDGSGAASMRQARWSTPGSRTEAASTRSSRRWPWTEPCYRSAGSGPSLC